MFKKVKDFLLERHGNNAKILSVFEIIWNLRDLDENIHIIKRRFHYVVQLLERILDTMVKQAELDAVAQALQVQGGTIQKIYTEVQRLKSQNPELDITAINQAIQENTDGLQSIDNLNPDDLVVDEPSDTPEGGEGSDVPATPADEVAGQQG